MVKAHLRVYSVQCAECDQLMQLESIFDDTKWYCLGCGKKVVFRFILVRTDKEIQEHILRKA